MYTKIIEEDFRFNQEQYSNTIKNKFSVFATAKTDFVELEKKNQGVGESNIMASTQLAAQSYDDPNDQSQFLEGMK